MKLNLVEGKIIVVGPDENRVIHAVFNAWVRRDELHATPFAEYDLGVFEPGEYTILIAFPDENEELRVIEVEDTVILSEREEIKIGQDPNEIPVYRGGLKR